MADTVKMTDKNNGTANVPKDAVEAWEAKGWTKVKASKVKAKSERS